MHLIFSLLLLTFFTAPAMAQEGPMRIVALGDSLTAGTGLPKGEDFATKLEAALIADGLNVKVQNAGISGNTTAQGLARLENAVAGQPKPRLVIVALGANDMLRRAGVDTARKNLAAILESLKAKNIPVFMIGMQNPGSFGPFMRGVYGDMYRDLAKEYDVPLYPYFLKGVVLDKALNQADGFHPNEKGVAVMVKNIAPEIADILEE